ncbi:hypothetical protein KP509_30G051700 [Ceratopteris richardii]|uniref:UVR domain-containing protein n=1 Tax=Ceratopteris richardii TaxID=49495 RepID=A0A8T2R3F4_CERRI|nr:hypothetical protein KP509_30G051700 [Ceratopteris richardii]
MAGPGIAAIGHMCCAYVGDVHNCSQEARFRSLPLSSSISVCARKPLLYDSRSRRGTNFLQTNFNRTVSVSCSSGDESNDASSSSSSSSHQSSESSHFRDDEDIEAGPPAFWDLQQLKAAAARISDPFRDLIINAGRTWQNCFDNQGKQNPQTQQDTVSEQVTVEDEKWDWERWKEHFIQVEDQEKLASTLKFQLDSAIEEEDFKEAARLKESLKEVEAQDQVSEVLSELKMALEEERYETATRLRDEAAAGLLGWWVGLAKSENDPYGRIINISSSFGRFVARGYSARQLASASTGAPLFEVFIRKDPQGYHQQVVYLQRGGTGDNMVGAPTSIDVNIVDMNTLAEDGRDMKKKDIVEALGEEKGKTGDAQDFDDGLNGIINFIKDRIPDVKLKVFRVIAQNGEDIPKIVEQILEEVEARENDATKKGNEAISEEMKNNSGDDDEEVQELQREIPIRLVVGGTLQNTSEDKFSKVPMRRQARIENQNKDHFLLHIDEFPEPVSAKESLSLSKAATVTKTIDPTDLPSEISKVVSNLDKVPVKVSKDMRELLKIAISQVQRRRGLSKCTSFQRIKITKSNKDPMTGLYIGAFGPYTSELVQLQRKYGHWHEEANMSDLKDTVEFFEYVEAVKLTGDLNVPAGQVTFRAKISKESRLPHRGIYPEELGVVARYKGQGRLAEPGFKNPQWVDGELLLLDGKGIGHINGAELGFVYSVPERHFLVLFNRLNLQTD